LADLDEDSPTMRVLAIYALETLHATEALPRLQALLHDDRRSNVGARVSVADAAQAAIASLRPAKPAVRTPRPAPVREVPGKIRESAPRHFPG
jgi:hypothetical protein